MVIEKFRQVYNGIVEQEITHGTRNQKKLFFAESLVRVAAIPLDLASLSCQAIYRIGTTTIAGLEMILFLGLKAESNQKFIAEVKPIWNIIVAIPRIGILATSALIGSVFPKVHAFSRAFFESITFKTLADMKNPVEVYEDMLTFERRKTTYYLVARNNFLERNTAASIGFKNLFHNASIYKAGHALISKKHADAAALTFRSAAMGDKMVTGAIVNGVQTGVESLVSNLGNATAGWVAGYVVGYVGDSLFKEGRRERAAHMATGVASSRVIEESVKKAAFAEAASGLSRPQIEQEILNKLNAKEARTLSQPDFEQRRMNPLAVGMHQALLNFYQNWKFETARDKAFQHAAGYGVHNLELYRDLIVGDETMPTNLSDVNAALHIDDLTARVYSAPVTAAVAKGASFVRQFL